MSQEPQKCVVCDAPAQGFYGRHGDEARSAPCCDECGTSGKAEEWFAKAVHRLADSPIAFQSSGNLLQDLKRLDRAELSDERISDGICPNGCARMIRHEPGNDFAQRCPSCGFVGFSNVAIRFPYEWQAEMPSEEGAYELKSDEDRDPEQVTVWKESDGILWVKMSLGSYPLKYVHDGLTNPLWKAANP